MADKKTKNATGKKREAGDSFVNPGKTQSAQGADTPGDTNGANFDTFYWTYVNGGSGENSMEMKRAKTENPLCRKGKQGVENWYRRVELNYRPTGYESVALTAELRRRDEDKLARRKNPPYSTAASACAAFIAC